METGVQATFINLPNNQLFVRLMGKKCNFPIYASDFKREYLFIKCLNFYFKCFSKKLDLLNHGLFESKISNTIKKYMKRFLRSQEKGKFNNINNIIIPNYDIDIICDIIFINEQFEFYKIRYDYFCDYSDDYSGEYNTDYYYDYDNEYFVDGKPYPGFKEFYDIFKMVFNQINYKHLDYNTDIDGLDFL